MKWRHVAYVASASEAGKQHELKRHPFSGILGCTCMAYRFNKSTPRTCKHLAAYGSASFGFAGMSSTESVLKVVTATETFTVTRAITFEAVVQ